MTIANSSDLLVELNNIIYRPALTQSVKGLITAGFTKSFRYSMAKVRKWFKARQSQK
jgi:translocator assembly and maintenance protein 41